MTGVTFDFNPLELMMSQKKELVLDRIYFNLTLMSVNTSEQMLDFHKGLCNIG